MQGWIKLHRKIRANPIFNDHQLMRLWLICLTEASHKERDQIIGKQTVRLSPGEFVTGRFDLTEMYNQGLKPKDKIKGDKTVFRWLETLEKGGFLTIKKTNKFSVVSIDNWGFYQDKDQQMDDEMTIKRPSNDHQMTTNKNVKKVKNERDYTTEIKNFLSRYQLISNFSELNKQYWDVIRETRKNGEVAKSVICNTMKKWEKYDPVIVQYALKSHIEAHSGKKEEYTIGIMRGNSKEEAEDKLNRLANKKVSVGTHKKDNTIRYPDLII
jgi:hypothetical protein